LKFRFGGLRKTIPYVVIGDSGYHNLHLLAGDAKECQELADGSSSTTATPASTAT
jgi:hypothetical protein